MTQHNCYNNTIAFKMRKKVENMLIQRTYVGDNIEIQKIRYDSQCHFQFFVLF
jgi:hypothetical protein